MGYAQYQVCDLHALQFLALITGVLNDLGISQQKCQEERSLPHTAHRHHEVAFRGRFPIGWEWQPIRSVSSQGMSALPIECRKRITGHISVPHQRCKGNPCLLVFGKGDNDVTQGGQLHYPDDFAGAACGGCWFLWVVGQAGQKGSFGRLDRW